MMILGYPALFICCFLIASFQIRAKSGESEEGVAHPSSLDLLESHPKVSSFLPLPTFSRKCHPGPWLRWPSPCLPCLVYFQLQPRTLLEGPDQQVHRLLGISTWISSSHFQFCSSLTELIIIITFLSQTEQKKIFFWHCCFKGEQAGSPGHSGRCASVIRCAPSVHL